MDASPKVVREYIARSKFNLQRKDVLRSLRALAHGLGLLTNSQIVGRERIEISILMEEAVRTLGESEIIKRAVPNGLSYKKGQERELAAVLTRMADALEKIMGRAEVEARRKRLIELDELILAGQTELDNKQPLEARKLFRKAMDAFGDEPGLFVDLGNRLMLAGHPAEACEYFQKSIDTNPTDQRAYEMLAQCLDAQGEGTKAEEILKVAVKRFRSCEQMLVRLAKGAVERRQWDEGLLYAEQALKQNPTNRDAKRYADTVSQRLYGTAYSPSGEEKPRKPAAPREPIVL